LSSSAKLEELRKKFDENPRRYFAPLANEYRKAGDFDQAIFICQEYLPQQPGHMSGHIVFGQALFEAKRFPEARAVFETALSLDPENLIALRHLADISRDLGDMASARTWYERVLHADPRNEEVQAIVEGLSSAAASTAEIPAAAAPASPAEGGGWAGAALERLQRLVRVRRAEDVQPGREAEAAVTVAERAIAGGDIARAVAAVETLQGPAAASAAPWLRMAHQRLAVDAALQRLEALLTARLGDTAAVPGSSG
jgi:tetratricopeptide (TPR) repeat protein